MYRKRSAVGITGVLYACTVQKYPRINTKKGQGGEPAVNRNIGMAVPPRRAGQGDDVKHTHW